MAARVHLDRGQARQLVEKIAEEHGHVPDHMWAKVPEDMRLYLQERWRAKDDKLAASVLTYVEYRPISAFAHRSLSIKV